MKTLFIEVPMTSDEPHRPMHLERPEIRRWGMLQKDLGTALVRVEIEDSAAGSLLGEAEVERLGPGEFGRRANEVRGMTVDPKEWARRMNPDSGGR